MTGGGDKRKRGKRRVRAAIEAAQPASPSAPEGPSGAPEWLARHFEMRPAGLYKIGNGTDQKTGEPKSDTWLCAPFSIEAETRDPDGEGWGLLLSWRDRDGRSHRQAFPRTLFAGGGECAELRGRFADAGLSLNGAMHARQALGEYFNLASSPRRARSAARIGWHWIGDRPMFLLQDATFGEAPEAVVLQNGDREASLFGIGGTLEEWRQEIGLRCGSNSRLLFAAACGFAGPLLSLLDQPGAGFNFAVDRKPASRRCCASRRRFAGAPRRMALRGICAAGVRRSTVSRV